MYCNVACFVQYTCPPPEKSERMPDEYCTCGRMLDRLEGCDTCRLIVFEAYVRQVHLRLIARLCALRVAILRAQKA